MATSSILGGEHAPMQPRGTDIDALGPSDTSDSGSDVQTDLNRSALPDDDSEGAIPMVHDSDSTSTGTGERASADPTTRGTDTDILPDRIGIVPADALDAAVSIDDPEAVSVEELAATEDDGSDEADEDEDDAGDDDGAAAGRGRA